MVIRKIVLLLSIMTIGVAGYCQVPQAINYQAVARKDGNGLVSKPISVRVSLLQGSVTGTAVYQETQTVTTDKAGVFSIKIGTGTSTIGAFDTIYWPSGNYFIKSEFDFGDGSGFQLSGTSQLLTVPYAYYSELAERTLSDGDTLATNEIQTLSRTGNKISISKGNTITIPDSTQWKNTPVGMIFNTNGRVGIGTSTPQSKLQVVGTIEASGGIKFPDGSIQQTGYPSSFGVINFNLPTNYVLTAQDITNKAGIYLFDGQWAGSITLPATGTYGQALEIINAAHFGSAIETTNTNLTSTWTLTGLKGCARFRWLIDKWWFMGGSN